MAQTVKYLPANARDQETEVASLGQEDPLEKGMATHSSILMYWIPWTEEPGWLLSKGWQAVRHDWRTNTFLHFLYLLQNQYYILAVVFQLLSHFSLCDCGLQHDSLLSPQLSLGVGSNSHPLSRWCCLTISAHVTPFSFCLHSFPVSGSFPMTHLLHQVAKVLKLQHQSFQLTFLSWLPLVFKSISFYIAPFNKNNNALETKTRKTKRKRDKVHIGWKKNRENH